MDPRGRWASGPESDALGREPLAALEPPSLDHRAAGAVGHAVAEAVALGAATVVRLVGALHGGCLLGSQGHGGPAPGIRCSRDQGCVTDALGPSADVVLRER